jgi:hypothetical protein
MALKLSDVNNLKQLRAKILHHLGWLNYDFTPFKNLTKGCQYYQESHELVIELKALGYEHT